MNGPAVLRDLRFATKALRRAPGFTFIAVLTLGLGIGASTSTFSVLNEILLRPMPYPDSGQLDRIYRVTAQNSRGSVAPADYLDLQPETFRYGTVAAYALADMSLSLPGEPADMARGLRVSANFFSTLGVEPQLGRSFRAKETVAGNDHVLIISRRYWQSRFGGDPHVIGRTVRVDGEDYEIVGVSGVMNDWRHLGPFDLFRPLVLTEEDRSDRTSAWVRLVGRRSNTLSRGQAEAFIAGFGRRLAADYPDVNRGSTWRTLPLNVAVAPDSGPGIFALLIGLSGFVLLIACSNLANLLLARTMARARELAVRTALGASRAKLLRTLLAESLLLALAGGVCSICIATGTNAWLRRFGEGFVFGLDWRVLGWAFGACLVTAVAFGIGPALFALRIDPNRTLKSGGRGSTGDRGHQRFRQVLVIGQFALALVLFAGATLFIRGLRDMDNRHVGWEADNLLTGTLLLPSGTYTEGQEIADFERLAVERLAALPGVRSASLSYSMPFFGMAEPRRYVVAGREAAERGQEPVAVTNGVTPRYFETVGTRVISGRAFADGDTFTSPRVFVINESMARGLFGGESPLGRRIARTGSAAPEWGEVVGVVADAKAVYPDRIPVTYQLYQPLAQEPRHATEIAVLTAAGTPSTLVESVRTTLTGLDADLAVRQLQPAETTIATGSYQWRVLGKILSFLAALGLGLASLGIYGVVTRTVAQRTGEFGIRLALGAQGGDIIRLVLASGMKLALVGSAIGLLGAAGLSRLIAATFPVMQTDSLPVLCGVTLLLIAVAQIACFVPARYAAKTSPTEALRAD